MTNSPKSSEYWYGIVTFITFIAAIVSRPEMSASDKIMTLSIVSAVPWAVSFISRKEEELKEAKRKERESKAQ